MAKSKKSKQARATEVDAYIFIKRKLAELGWNTRNPERNDEGQVWTQNECLSNPYIKRYLGIDRPENIIKVTESVLWVIEAKRSHGQIDQAIGEAQDYAAKINEGKRKKVRIISGVAGNDDDGYIVCSQLLVGKTWSNVQINGIDTTGLLSPDECQKLIESKQPNLEDPPINEVLFIATAEKINEILYEGAVNPNDRAKVVSALLLSMLTATGPNIEERDTACLSGTSTIAWQASCRGKGNMALRSTYASPSPRRRTIMSSFDVRWWRQFKSYAG